MTTKIKLLPMVFAMGVNTWDYMNGIPCPPRNVTTESWDEYVDCLRGYAAIPRHPREKDGATPWTAPFILSDGAPGRGIHEVVRMAPFASVDLDEAGWSSERIDSVLRGCSYVAHTTTKSRPAHQRWRVLIQLDREHTVDEFGSVWRFCNSLFLDQLDPPTKNANRILYVPSAWEGADNEFHHRAGEPVPVDEITAVFPPEAASLIAPMPQIGSTPARGEIIQDWMISRFHTEPAGGRFYRLMVRAAKRYRQNDWELTAEELANAALLISPTEANGSRRKNASGEAKHALGYVMSHIQPMTQLEKISRRLSHKNGGRTTYQIT